MESARDKHTREIVEAEDLWLLDSVDTEGYVCWGCGITMHPAAWEKDKKVRAYFKKKRHIQHHHECDADAESTVIRQGQKASVRNILDSAPGLMPSGLKLIEKRPVVEPGFSGDESKSSSTRSASSQSGEGNSSERQSRRQVNAIRNICRAFIRFPHDRGMSLNVPGISGQIYMTAFKKLRNEIQPYPEPKIFYAPLLWNKFTENDENLIIPLSGEWGEDESGKPKPTRSYQIYIDWAGWSKAKRTVVRKELEAARTEAIEAKGKRLKDKAWVFFIGEQSADNPEIFYVSDYRLICAIVGHITYP
ncbi:hypothetical protein [Salmonella enterica]|uniref:hypothetical protein n=1 Tax=Salmonella enterica TaxID=28901 RepID=UPI000F716FA5|nr:hypothetical protein [Salmonella enterica]EBV1910049.1 hypothetical protein [Salmonella enterica subsp. enterica serovar Kande]EDT2836638.1 hypothetical protein [Salmonella enterica subsp. enterica]MDR7956655.1 hypothetical protein [Salmonella enterica subsp. enterica serovar Gatineau]MDR7967433.1 hypothetical protein [Salmonella enterica subsp. enterica serovar Gatineau]MDR7971846.1 hypothetical protein [Salmonella enterica subsp. enterica serovar Gatineau]